MTGRRTRQGEPYGQRSGSLVFPVLSLRASSVIPISDHIGKHPQSATKGTQSQGKRPWSGTISNPTNASIPPIRGIKDVLPFVTMTLIRVIQFPMETKAPNASAAPPTIHRTGINHSISSHQRTLLFYATQTHHRSRAGRDRVSCAQRHDSTVSRLAMRIKGLWRNGLRGTGGMRLTVPCGLHE